MAEEHVVEDNEGKAGLTVAIQAGGESSRMGRDKSFVPYEGKPMIETVRQQVAELGDELIIITNDPEPYRYLQLPLYGDHYPGAGPLAGIHASLEAAAAPFVLVVACDMPLLNRDLLRYLISLKETADVIVPLWGKFPEPLHAVYSKRCIPAIESCLAANKNKITGFYSDVTVRMVTREELQRFDPEGRSFTNVNTPDDLN